MENIKGTGKAAKDEVTNDEVKTALGVSKEQMDELLKTIIASTAAAAAETGQRAAAAYIEAARPELEKKTEEVSQKAVAEAMARKQKTSTLKTYGLQAAVSAGVFALGTLTLVGVDKYRHRNDSRANAMNPNYQGGSENPAM